MNAQDIFYILGSIYLGLGILMMIVVIGAVFIILKKLGEIEKGVKNRVEQELQEIKDKPRLLASYIGSIVAKGIKNKFMRED